MIFATRMLENMRYEEDGPFLINDALTNCLYQKDSHELGMWMRTCPAATCLSGGVEGNEEELQQDRSCPGGAAQSAEINCNSKYELNGEFTCGLHHQWDIRGSVTHTGFTHSDEFNFRK